jgi:UDP-4-amino-4,6-dideoxy-N-acetyl-beta-L-altrosamine transaminase
VIPYGRHFIDEDDIQAVVDVLRNGALTQGPVIEAFEGAIAAYVGAKYAVAVSSATAGLHLAAVAAGVGPGTALITSPITFVASANAALYAGAAAAFCDIDADTINMVASSLFDALRKHPNVRVVMPVHFAGLPCDMPAIRAASDAAGAVVIEDAAHALGAHYPDGQRVGCCAHSLMAVFSFHPVKNIATGEGGMITTNDEAIYRRLLRLRSHGINKLNDSFQLPELATTGDLQNPWYYEMQELGFHYRVTDLQCALGLAQLKKLDRFLARRTAMVRAYDQAFAGMQTLRPAQSSGRDRSGHHLYVVRIDYAANRISRAELMQLLRAKQIVTQVHYIPVPAQPHYQRLGFNLGNYANAKKYYEQALSIPLFYGLADAQQDLVISAIKELVR